MRWGEERVAVLAPNLNAVADALWLLSQQPLDLTGEVPDFLTHLVAQDA